VSVDKKKHLSRKTLVISAVTLCLLLTAGVAVLAAYFLKDTTTNAINTLAIPQVSCDVVETFDTSAATADIVKEDVRLRNTGNIPAYLRAKLIINWVNDDGEVILMPGAGYSYEITGPASEGASTFGNSDLDWELDGDYWYYEKVVAPGQATTDLIETIRQTLPASADCHLRVTILSEAIQAVPATARAEAWGR